MRIRKILMLGSIILTLTAFGLAIEGAQTTTGNNETSNTGDASNVTIAAGSVLSVDVSQDSLTDKWAGFYGTISGNKVLGSSSGTMYSWTASDFSGAEVITTPQGDPVPTGVAQVSNPNTFLGSEYDSGTADASTTYSNTESISVLGSTTSTAAVDTYDDGGTESTSFTTLLYNNTATATKDPIYVAEGNNDLTGFDGSTVNYQMLVGVGETADHKSYTFYLELP